ncbi:ubiquinol-cytochrome C chaperone family protein [Pseudoblastomonas halimionae]|uniref:ubiquinol-cytochrome C chaperone family protein n=1 Tax=Alteriqipengyuania halimionae TaxID=1926630 RepID=UPI001F228DAC|nr:ubiquinol-cytochrome C chaperone family protein [Alteriqipengyuania halimionae]
MKRLFARLFSSRPDPAEELRPLWHAIVREARDPAWYEGGGIADTIEGRFDAVTLVTALVMIRMDRDPPLHERSARLTELFVSDMEGQLREGGVGDLVVGKKVGMLVGTLAGRIDAYREGLEKEGGNATLEDAIERNVTLEGKRAATKVAVRTRELHDRLARLDSRKLLEGDLT